MRARVRLALGVCTRFTRQRGPITPTPNLDPSTEPYPGLNLTLTHLDLTLTLPSTLIQIPLSHPLTGLTHNKPSALLTNRSSVHDKVRGEGGGEGGGLGKGVKVR